MRLKTFKGGVHAPDRKELTRGQADRGHAAAGAGGDPPAAAHRRALRALVKEGDASALGQKIGEAKSFVSAPVHASISGKVTAVQALPAPGDADAGAAVVIEAAPATAAGVPRRRRPGRSRRLAGPDGRGDQARIREAGVVGLGGAAFPTHVKLSPSAEKRIDALILNGVECEPYLTTDHRLMLEQGEEILEGPASC